MAKSSDIAKEIIINKLKEIYPNGKVVDKKFYVNLNIEGEEVQISITLTAPKSKIDLGGTTETAPAAPSIDKERIKSEAAEIFDFFRL